MALRNRPGFPPVIAHSERMFVSFPVGLLLRNCRLFPLLRLLPQVPTVSDHPLHVFILLRPGRRPLLCDDVTLRDEAGEGACKSAGL